MYKNHIEASHEENNEELDLFTVTNCVINSLKKSSKIPYRKNNRLILPLEDKIVHCDNARKLYWKILKKILNINSESLEKPPIFHGKKKYIKISFVYENNFNFHEHYTQKIQEVLSTKNIFEHYILNRTQFLRSGGAGNVYKIQNDTQEFALKVLKDSTPFLEKSFDSEAKTYEKIQNAPQYSRTHIAKSYNMHTVNSSIPEKVLIMEYVNGEDVQNYIAGLVHKEYQKNPYLQYNQLESLAVAAHMAKAISQVHSFKIVHRDIKPDNFKIVPHEGVKIFDFGLADTHLYKTKMKNNSRLGTVGYAPLHSKEMDERFDIYSLGILIATLLYKKDVFQGESSMQIEVQQRNAKKTPIQHDKAFSKSIHTLLDAMAHKNPKKRKLHRKYLTAEKAFEVLQKEVFHHIENAIINNTFPLTKLYKTYPQSKKYIYEWSKNHSHKLIGNQKSFLKEILHFCYVLTAFLTQAITLHDKEDHSQTFQDANKLQNFFEDTSYKQAFPKDFFQQQHSLFAEDETNIHFLEILRYVYCLHTDLMSKNEEKKNTLTSFWKSKNDNLHILLRKFPHRIQITSQSTTSKRKTHNITSFRVSKNAVFPNELKAYLQDFPHFFYAGSDNEWLYYEKNS